MANARVEDEAIARLLTPDVARRIVEAYLRERKLTTAEVYGDREQVAFYLRGELFTVKGGAVGGPERRVVDELTAALTAAGEALFAARVQRALGRLAPGKAVAARSVEVEENGARARATILTLNL